jgi:hypothetical protein
MITYLLFVGVSAGNDDGGGGTNGSDLVSSLNRVSLTFKLLPLSLLPLVRPFSSLLLLSEIFLELFFAKASIPIVVLAVRIPADIKEKLMLK